MMDSGDAQGSDEGSPHTLGPYAEMHVAVSRLSFFARRACPVTTPVYRGDGLFSGQAEF